MRGNFRGQVNEFAELQVTEIRELEESDGFALVASGIADIRAQHWGHLDQRLVHFQLLLDLVEVDGQWRLADATLTELNPL